MAYAQKPHFVFRRNGRVHLNRQGASVQSTTGSRGVRISGSNAGYTTFRGSVKSTGYPLHSLVSLSLPLPCVTVCHHISNGLYQRIKVWQHWNTSDSMKTFRPSTKLLDFYAHIVHTGAVLHQCKVRIKRLRWSRGSVLAFSTQVRGFKPGRSRRIFKGEKILSTPSFGGKVKPSVPCRRFAACKRSLNVAI
jgi:hypothetical protein